MHVCFYIYDIGSIGWFKEIIKHYEDIMETNPSDYKRLYLWNDEGIDNAMRWKYGYTNHLSLSNFDTSSYDGDAGFIDKTLHHFYKFWNEEGPQNFDRIFGLHIETLHDNNDITFEHFGVTTNLSGICCKHESKPCFVIRNKVHANLAQNNQYNFLKYDENNLYL